MSKTFFLKNGFEEFYISKSNTWLVNKNTNIIVKITHENCFKCNIDGIKLEYVHEFQHLMRLLGLFDYVNNLKV